MVRHEDNLSRILAVESAGLEVRDKYVAGVLPPQHGSVCLEGYPVSIA